MTLVAESGLPRRRTLDHLGLSKSTYYRWLRRQAEGRLQDKQGGSSIPWNKLKPKEVTKILSRARESPELSSRQLALQLVDNERWYVSESTVFRILKQEGLIKPAEIIGFKAGNEYHRKTRRPNAEASPSKLAAISSLSESIAGSCTVCHSPTPITHKGSLLFGRKDNQKGAISIDCPSSFSVHGAYVYSRYINTSTVSP